MSAPDDYRAAPSDHAERRRAHGRNFRRPQSRRPDAEPARRRTVLRADLAARSHQRHRRGCAERRADRPRRRRFDARSPFDLGRLRRAAQRSLCAALPARRRRPRQHQAQLFQAGRRGRPLRPVAARSRPASGRRHYLENRQYWNFGCASQRNLAAMVDNPADLVQPRGETPAYTARRSVAIDKYRKGENPSATYSRLRHRQDQRSRQMIKHASQVAVAESSQCLPRPSAAPPTSISRRRRAFRSRRFARRSKPPRLCRPPAKTAAWARRM